LLKQLQDRRKPAAVAESQQGNEIGGSGMIVYQTNLKGISPKLLSNFCVGWKNPLSGEKLKTVLKASYCFILARDGTDGPVVGFVNSLSDGINFAFIPMLEVLPEYQSQGIGTTLLKMLFTELKDIPCIDLTCDAEMQSYYARFGMLKSWGMVFRKY
jgi:ribosomal protein S18 acetylase RimI-like enzyme